MALLPSRRLAAALLAGLLALAACGSGEEASPPLRADPAKAIPAEPARSLYAELGSGEAERMRAALERIREAGDRRFIPVLIDLLHFGQMELVELPAYNELVIALERLSGESFGGDWFAWAEWYGGTELDPPPGFTGWKGRMLAKIDPAFGELLAEGRRSRLRVGELQWGGVRVDGIPALDEPERVPAEEAGYLEPGEPVLGLSIGGEARAYPLRILDWHEVVNDRFGDLPVTVAYCALCGAGVAFEARAGGRALDFGTSGLLYRSNKLLYDRGTRTLWSQMTGRPVLGPLVGRELRLEAHPLVVSRWADWRSRHPGTSVLSLETGFERDYEPGQPYGRYFASEESLYPVHLGRRALEPKARVFGVAREGAAKAWPLGALLAEGVLNDEAGGTSLVLVAREERARVRTRGPRGGELRYDAGAPVRAYRRGARRFAPGPEPGTLRDAEGRSWRVTEAALLGPEGERAPRAAGTLAYWFAWQSFHPRSALYRRGS